MDSTQLPRVPATKPANAIATFKIKPGFRLELVAAEPLVVDPIALSFDEEGRLYVVEMRDYSERRAERLGRIRRLEDIDGDGRFDRSTVFAENFAWPTAVFCWDGGVFVGATPDLLYLKDTNGDGVADVRETIFTGFGNSLITEATNRLNVQALLNSLNWSLDNRIHGATSFNGGRVSLVDSAFTRAWRRRGGRAENSPPLDLRGRDFSFDPRTLELRAETGGGQHGLSFDNQGRKFVCANANHLQLVMYEDRDAARNSFGTLPRALVDIAADGGAAPVFRISPDEPWRVLRTQWRVNGLVPGPIEGGGRASGYFTGATGATIYRGDALGEDFVGDAFIGDAGGNLVHRKKLRPVGTSLVAERPADERDVEFLASTDNWFRPVQFANAPDGCLYLCDMYREVIEHPWSLPESLKKHLDLNSGSDRGRLYRVVKEKHQQRPPPRLRAADSATLVNLLEHPNGWHRDTAARLLYERRDASATPALIALLKESSSPLGRLHALCALRGQDALTPALLAAALKDRDAAVRQKALRFASPNASNDLASAIAALADDTDAGVRFQLAFALPDLPKPLALDTAASLLREGRSDDWTRAAVLNSLGSLGSGAARLFTQSGLEPTFLPELARLIGVQNHPVEITAVLDTVEPTRGSGRPFAIAVGLAEGLERAGSSLSVADGNGRLRPLFASARLGATNQSWPNDAQIAAIQLLGFAPFAEAAPTLLALLEARHPRPVQTAALQALGRSRAPTVADELLKRWPEFSPVLRGEIVGVLLRRPERMRALLTALEQGAVRAQELSAAQQAALRKLPDSVSRERVEKVLGAVSGGLRQAVVESYRPALLLEGNVANGRKHFQARCASCHRLGGEGQALGPDLATVKAAGKEKLLTNIVDPNREVAANYLSYLVETKDGESLLGLVSSESAASVTLRQAGGSETVVSRANLASMRSQGASLMPEGLEAGLSFQDMADLLEFLVR